MPEPWDRQPGEPPREYEAFCAFLHQTGHRTTEAVAHKLGRSLAVVERWSRRWKWADRADAWDTRLPNVRDGHGDGTEDRQIKTGRLMQSLALQRLRAMAPGELSPSEAMRLLGEGARIEREATRKGPKRAR